MSVLEEGRVSVCGEGGGGRGGGSYATLLQSFCSQHIYICTANMETGRRTP